MKNGEIIIFIICVAIISVEILAGTALAIGTLKGIRLVSIEVDNIVFWQTISVHGLAVLVVFLKLYFSRNK